MVPVSFYSTTWPSNYLSSWKWYLLLRQEVLKIWCLHTVVYFGFSWCPLAGGWTKTLLSSTHDLRDYLEPDLALAVMYPALPVFCQLKHSMGDVVELGAEQKSGIWCNRQLPISSAPSWFPGCPSISIITFKYFLHLPTSFPWAPREPEVYQAVLILLLLLLFTLIIEASGRQEPTWTPSQCLTRNMFRQAISS